MVRMRNIASPHSLHSWVGSDFTLMHAASDQIIIACDERNVASSALEDMRYRVNSLIRKRASDTHGSTAPRAKRIIGPLPIQVFHTRQVSNDPAVPYALMLHTYLEPDSLVAR
jgi:hypothetical protein